MFLRAVEGVKRLFMVSDFFLVPQCLVSPAMEMEHPQCFLFEVVCFQIRCSHCCTPWLQISVFHRLPLVLNVAVSVKLINYVTVSPSAHFTIPSAPSGDSFLSAMSRTSLRICPFLLLLQQETLKEIFSDFICSLITHLAI